MHPEVYILIIPACGVVSHVVRHFSGMAVFGQDGPYRVNNLYATYYMQGTKWLSNVVLSHSMLIRLVKINIRGDLAIRRKPKHDTCQDVSHLIVRSIESEACE